MTTTDLPVLAPYVIRDPSAVSSPALLFYPAVIRRNIAAACELGGGPERLRPHVKTHKTREVAALELAAGIRKHKCATIAEAELLASAGAPDVLLAYPLVGPNCGRLARLAAAYPGTRFSTTVDHPRAARALADAFAAAGRSIDVLLDLDVGQHRTGIAPGEEALSLYGSLARLPGLRPDGFHVYDGHNHGDSPADRAATVRDELAAVLALRDAALRAGLPVPRLVVGGTPSFPAFARLDLPGLECSPGTCFLHDDSYGRRFADLAPFQHAALLLTRVISRPTPSRVTLDLGYKAVASDPPAGQRCRLLGLGPYQAVLQNEEHLVLETPDAERFAPGDVLYAVPTHVCPTVALHRQAYVVEDGQVTGAWDIVGRDRVLTV